MPASFLKFVPFASSATWEFINPENGRKFVAPSREKLIQLIVNYRAQNQLPPILHLNDVLENYLCTLPCNVGKCQPTPLKRGLLQYLKGGIALLTNLWIDKPVPQEEADRRSSICKDCKFNDFPDRDMFVKWSDEIAVHSIGNKKSLHHNALGNCLACSCPLRAKVWTPKETIKLSKDEALQMRTINPRCWQIEK